MGADIEGRPYQRMRGSEELHCRMAPSISGPRRPPLNSSAARGLYCARRPPLARSSLLRFRSTPAPAARKTPCIKSP